MNPVTPANLAEARTLVAERHALMAKLHRLTETLAQLSARTAASNAAYNDRLKLRQHPERLAGLAELYHRNAPLFRRGIAIAYEGLLEDMIDPVVLPGSGLPKPRPHQIDFHALPRQARPYLLGPYLGIHPGNRFARLCLDTSRPATGRLVMLQTGGPVDADLWRGHIPTINAWLGGSWAVTDVAANALVLEQRTPLPAALSMRSSFLRPGALFLGINTETHQAAYLPFAEMTSGTFIVGAAGSGKSNATHLLMASILANLDQFQAVFCVDGKEGMTFARYRDAAPHKLRILTEEADLWRLVEQLVTVTRARNSTLARLGRDKATNNYIALIIEEMSTYTAKPSTDAKSAANKAHAQFITDLASLARKGRSAGLKILITAQDPTQEQVPTAVRANCQTAIIFRLGIDTHATMALAGDIPPGADPRKLTTGRALVKRDNGSLITVQFPVMPEPGGRP